MRTGPNTAARIFVMRLVGYRLLFSPSSILYYGSYPTLQRHDECLEFIDNVFSVLGTKCQGTV